MKKKFKEKIADLFIAFNQILVYVIFSRFLRYYFRANKKVAASIGELKKGSLIVANHQSILDPFIILSHLPLKSFLRTIPVRFPTKHSYYKYLRLLAFVGAFDIGDQNRERMLGLFRTRQYLVDGKSIMLFPEGKICTNAEAGIDEFQKGITFLTDVAKNVLFVRMEGFHRSDWLKIMKKRRSMAFSEICQMKGENKNPDVLREYMERLSA